MKKIKKLKSLKSLQHKADRIFSEFIRRTYCIKHSELVKCITCVKTTSWHEMQCGHYIPRNHLSTRYEENNAHPQCVGCNVFKKGRLDEYALYLLNSYGENILELLSIQKREIITNSRELYNTTIDTYTQKLKTLK